ncbi:putative integral membrane protein [Brugia pahangi]
MVTLLSNAHLSYFITVCRFHHCSIGLFTNVVLPIPGSPIIRYKSVVLLLSFAVVIVLHVAFRFLEGG